MHTTISPECGLSVNDIIDNRPHFIPKQYAAVIAMFTLGVSATTGFTQSPSQSVVLHTSPQVLSHSPSTIARGYDGVWEITLYWYLEWINQILTDALEKLDALDSPENWMSDVENSYLVYGIPGNLSPTETQEFLDIIEETHIHLASAPEDISAAAVISCKSLLCDMEVTILSMSSQ